VDPKWGLVDRTSAPRRTPVPASRVQATRSHKNFYRRLSERVSRMPRPVSRQAEIEQIHFYPAHPGSRAVFIVEARSRKEMRQIPELFDMVGQLAEVVAISHGTVMSYAVQVDGDTSLFGKIEWLLKTQFTFSIVERNFSDVSFRLISSLCEEAETSLEELPECGVCGAMDPFPFRATVRLRDEEAPAHLAYCVRCAGRYAEEDERALIRGLIRRDRTSLRVLPETPVTVMPEIVEERPEWEAGAMAAMG
jgi:hypothetical protein